MPPAAGHENRPDTASGFKSGGGLRLSPVTTGSAEWKNLIRSAAAELDISVSPEQTEAFAIHAGILLTWNKKTNLTAITDPREVALKHFVDSAALAPLIPEKARILDLGAGGGFPGAVLHVLRPDSFVLMVDKVRKKVSFLRYLAAALGAAGGMDGLPGLNAVRGRAEDLAKMPEYAGKFDIVVCRAFAELRLFVQLARPFIRPKGLLIAMKGPQAADEIKAAERSFPDVECRVLRSFRLPGMKERRYLVRIRLV